MIVRCGACEQRMTVGPELMGQQVGCPNCGTTLRLPGSAAPIVVPPVVPAAVNPAAVRPAAVRPAAVRPTAVNPTAGQPRVVVPAGRGGALVHRCPNCRSDVEHGNTLCPRCGVNIKRARKKAHRF